MYIYIYIYIFTGPLAQGVLDPRYQSLILNPLRGFNPSPISPPQDGPGAKSRCAIHKLWLRRGLVVA